MRFSPKQMQLIDIIESVWPEYEVTGRLGAGQYGVVFLAVRDDPGSGIRTEEAIKIIDLRSENDVDAAEQMGISLEEYYELKKHSELEEIRTLERLKGASHIIHISDYKVVESEDLSSCYILIRMDAMTSLKKIMAEHEEDSLEEAERFAKKVGLDMCRVLFLSAVRRRDEHCPPRYQTRQHLKIRDRGLLPRRLWLCPRPAVPRQPQLQRYAGIHRAGSRHRFL